MLITSMLLCSTLFAEPTREQVETVTRLVDTAFVQPLNTAESRRGKYSRARRSATERMVRFVNPAQYVDTRGRKFVRFLIDERTGRGDWRKAATSGCAYLETREVYVVWNDELAPASRIVKQGDKHVPPGACENGEPAA